MSVSNGVDVGMTEDVAVVVSGFVPLAGYALVLHCDSVALYSCPGLPATGCRGCGCRWDIWMSV